MTRPCARESQIESLVGAALAKAREGKGRGCWVQRKRRGRPRCMYNHEATVPGPKGRNKFQRDIPHDSAQKASLKICPSQETKSSLRGDVTVGPPRRQECLVIGAPPQRSPRHHRLCVIPPDRNTAKAPSELCGDEIARCGVGEKAASIAQGQQQQVTLQRTPSNGQRRQQASGLEGPERGEEGGEECTT